MFLNEFPKTDNRAKSKIVVGCSAEEKFLRGGGVKCLPMHR